MQAERRGEKETDIEIDREREEKEEGRGREKEKKQKGRENKGAQFEFETIHAEFEEFKRHDIKVSAALFAVIESDVRALLKKCKGRFSVISVLI